MSIEEITKKLDDLQKKFDEGVTKQEELQAANKRQEQIIALCADERAVFDKLPAEKQAEYLAADEEARKAFEPTPESEDDPEVAKRMEEVEKRHAEELAAVNKKMDDLEKKAAAAEALRKRVESIAKAEKEYPNLPGSPEEKGSVLLSLDKLDEKEREAVDKLLIAGNGALGKAMVEKGSSADDGGAGTAYKQLEAKAREIQKADSATFEKAFDRALTENPELYNEYKREEAAGRA